MTSVARALLGMDALWQLEVVARLCLQIGLLTLAGVAMLAALRARSSARERHAVWTGVLACSLCLPLVWLVVPARRIPISVWTVSASLDNPVVLDGPRAVVARLLDLASPAELPPTVAGAVPSSLPASLLLIWFAGASLFLLRLAWGAWRLRRLARAGSAADPVAVRVLRELHAELRLRRPVRLVMSPGFRIPATAGVLHPVILWPTAAIGWSADRIRAVLLHELTHVRRGDWPFQLLAQVACAVYWFHPLVWIVAKRHRLQSELACDLGVVHQGMDPRAYARALVAVAGCRELAKPPVLMIPFASGSDLEARVRALLAAQAVPLRRPRARVLVAALLLAFGLVAGVAPGVGACGAATPEGKPAGRATTAVHFF